MQDIKITIPENLATAKLPDPGILTYYRNIENRTLWLDGDVDDIWLQYERQIIEWNRDDCGVPSEDRAPIKLCFYSYGGDIDINESFISLIKLSKTPIIGINMGQACSAGCFIFMACHKRLALRGSRFLLHQGGAQDISGTYEQVVSYVMEYQRQVDNLCQYIKEHSNIPDDVLEERISTEWYMTAEEAVKYGICDAIVSDIDEII
jgi:ATP-dependent Clp protease protease subunit